MAGPLRIFLSSTALDLMAHRDKVDDTLLRLQQQSVRMERFGPRPGIPVEECERLAADCDVLICVVAHRYGYEPEPGKGSITRREVEAAQRAGKPVLVWIVDDAFPWAETKERDIPIRSDTVVAESATVSEGADAGRSLQDFKAWLRKTFVTESFTTPDDLGRRVAIVVGQFGMQRASSSGISAQASRPPDLHIAHALQPAPHFHGREDLVEVLSAWVDDTASPYRVQALVAAGGTGKTAVAEKVVSRLRQSWPAPGAGSVLVWSFYEEPNADAFLRECAQLFLGEPSDETTGGRLERLQRGLRDGRPHLIVLDGLERVQAEAGQGRVRGELEDQQVRVLLQCIAAGLGRTRALITSRFPLVDLRNWQLLGVVETSLDDLTPIAARHVLSGWGVHGSDWELDAVAAQVGCHALSVAVIGSYLSHFEEGRVEAVATFDLDAVAGADIKARKLTKILAFYAQRLSASERDLLTRLAIFQRGVTLEMLGVLINAGGAVAGSLSQDEARIPFLLNGLAKLGLVFRYSARNGATTWTAHPFVRQSFAKLLNCPTAKVFDAVATSLEKGLEERPEQRPEDGKLLDQYEQFIEATCLAGRPQLAFDIYRNNLGGRMHLAWRLGEYGRNERILRNFLPPSGKAKGFGKGLSGSDRQLGLYDLFYVLLDRGRLTEAAMFAFQYDSEHFPPFALAIRLGHLKEALRSAEHEFSLADSTPEFSEAHARVALVRHYLGDISAARAEFRYCGGAGPHQELGRHFLDVGNLDACRAICDDGLSIGPWDWWNYARPGFHGLAARCALAEGKDPGLHLSALRQWTARTGDVQQILEAHEIASRWALINGDLPTAKAEIEDGLLQSRLCGFGLRTIEMLTTLAAIELAWPHPAEALKAAREALDLATASECANAWGEADAAQAWGDAFVLLRQKGNARRAFEQALAVRERIEHPQVQVTREALAKLTA